MWRLSSAYLMLITTTLSVYYLPKLSELQDSMEIKKEILKGYKIIFPGAVISGIVMFLLRDFIIDALFTKDFSKMEVLFAWQIVGDVLKIVSWILAYLMLSKAMTKSFIFFEILFSILFYVLTVYFTNKMQLEGVALAHAVNYGLYGVSAAFSINYALIQKESVVSG